ncbi:MAG: asparagine synthase (glutamine-hydrolyzing) [Cyclobacteriaceae bacterium]
MCGIIGYKSFKSNASILKESLGNAVHALVLRGPDSNGVFFDNKIGLGHTRLSIIDTSENANQPMTDSSGRYTLIFNGEIYNYQELNNSLSGVTLKSTSDTEVLLYLLIKEGVECLRKLNGFFAFAFYDNKEDVLILARDQMGIKPLLYFNNEDQFVFASEMKALLRFPIPRKLNHESLHWYLKLNYLPGNLSMLEGVQKLEPGHFLRIQNNSIKIESYLVEDSEKTEISEYSQCQSQLVSILDDSVKRRLISDVPLGSFLSGGTDSSAIVALASRHTSSLQTFSIGYKDHPFFDETKYAELVADKFRTNHTTFKLTNDDLLNDLNNILNYIDEPFADSSAIPTYILSKHTKKHVTVALSGDGADELFGGYYKHRALAQALNQSFINGLIRISNPIAKALPKSRSGRVGNLIRRMERFGTMLKMDSNERYWYLASLTDDPSFLLKHKVQPDQITQFKDHYLTSNPNLSDYLVADQKIVLPGDMLTKVDLMSMANSLEVRVPFLDKEVVSFSRSLPDNFKVRGNERKRILQDAFREILPQEIYHRPKKGFEVPLLDWMKNELLSDLDQTLFDKDYLEHQGLFNSDEVLRLRSILLSRNPGDVHGIIWALYIFQKWYSNWFLNE